MRKNKEVEVPEQLVEFGHSANAAGDVASLLPAEFK